MEPRGRILAKKLLVGLASLLVGFAIAAPLRFGIVRFHSANDQLYNALFWGFLTVLFLGLLLFRSSIFEKPLPGLITGFTIGYVSSLLGYIGLVLSLGQSSQVLRAAQHTLMGLLVPLRTLGWVIGGMVALTFYFVHQRWGRESQTN